MTIDIKAARNIVLESDYAFRSTFEPFSRMTCGGQPIRASLRKMLLNGTCLFVVRRNLTPNRWFVTKNTMLNPLEEWPSHETELMLDYAPAVGLLNAVAKSGSIVDYGAAMQSYIQTYGGAAFQDQGLPLWETYKVSSERIAKELARRAKAETSATWFNNQFAVAPVALADLAEPAIAVLARYNTASRIWLHRSIAQPVLDLVRAGYGRVSPDGFFQITSLTAQAQASSIAVNRGFSLLWANPAYIDKRIDQYYANPKHRFSSFKGKLPKLQYSN